MITKTFKILVLTLVLSVAALSGVSALAQVSTPPNCNPAVDGDGCYPPINVGANPQKKTGSLEVVGWSTFHNGIGFLGNSIVNAGKTFVFRNSNNTASGTIQAIGTSAAGSSLTLTGTGVSPNRKVTILDNLYTGNIYANNYFVCNASGACSPFVGGGDSFWKNDGNTANIYSANTGNVGIGTNFPMAKLSVVGGGTFSAGLGVAGNSTFVGSLDVGNSSDTLGGPAYVNINSATNRTAGVKWADAGTSQWWLYKSNTNAVSPATGKDLILANGPTGATPKVTFSNGTYTMNVVGKAKADSLCIGTDCRTAWPTGGTGGGVTSVTAVDNSVLITPTTGAVTVKVNPSVIPWTTNGGNIYNNNTGNVGIGTSNPSASKLFVNGYGIFSDGIGLSGDSIVGNGKKITFNTPNDASSGVVKGVSDSLELTGVGTPFNRKVTILDNLFVNKLCTGTNSCKLVSEIINNINGTTESFWTKVSGYSNIVYSSGIGVKTTGANSQIDVAMRNPKTGISATADTNGINLYGNGVVLLNLDPNGIVTIPASNPSASLCLGGVCKKNWPTDSAYEPVTCTFTQGHFDTISWANDGTARGLSEALTDEGLKCKISGYNRSSNNTPRNYKFQCPDNYKIVSGGIWCDSDSVFKVVRESRPDGKLAWKAGCLGINAGSTFGINLINNNVTPGGASIVCSK